MKHHHIALKAERAVSGHPAGLAIACTAILVALWAVAKHVIDRRYPI
jgi:hypothetical protein